MKLNIINFEFLNKDFDINCKYFSFWTYDTKLKFSIIKYGSGNQIPIERWDTSFLPLYEIPNETMNKLVYGYQLKTSQLKQDSHYKTSFIMIKICALRYMNIISTNKNIYMYEKLDTNWNWYSLKCKHAYTKKYMSIQKCQYWYQLKESNDTNWNNNNIKCIPHITYHPFMFKFKKIFSIKHTWAWLPI